MRKSQAIPIIKLILRERSYFLIGVIACAAICLAPTPLGLSVQGKYAVGLLVLVIIFFLTEAIPLPAVALVIGSYQIFFGITPFRDVPMTYMHDAVFFIMGSLMIATVLIKYRIHNRVALIILSRFGAHINRVVLGIVVTCAITAAFISDHAIAAIMLPVGIAFVAASGGIKKVPQLGKLIMISIAYGCAIGGLATPSGGARNVIMMGYLKEFFQVEIGYGEWMVYGFPLTFVMIPITTFLLLKIFKPEVSDLSPAAESLRGELKEMGPMRGKEWTVLGLFVLTVVFWITLSKKIGLGHIAAFSAVVYLVSGLASWEDYQKNVNWGVVLLYAGAISLGKCLETTGAAIWLAQKFLGLAGTLFGVKSGLPLIACTSTFTTFMTNTMADGPTIAVIGPIILNVGKLAGINPILIGLSCAMSAAFAYLLIIGTPPNAIVYGSGYLKPKDFIKAGWALSLISIFLLVVVIVGFYWKLLGLH